MKYLMNYIKLIMLFLTVMPQISVSQNINQHKMSVVNMCVSDSNYYTFEIDSTPIIFNDNMIQVFTGENFASR